LELRCDHKENISAIFIDIGNFNGVYDGLLGVSFSWNRHQLLEHFGAPAKSGRKMSDPILGDYGAWDRFAMLNYSVHIEYETSSEGIKKITFIREDAVLTQETFLD
jgi:hypothetical protein